MVEYVKEVEVLASREGQYSVYVFKDILSEEYLLCTRLPNWQIPQLSVGMKGFLQYQIVNVHIFLYRSFIHPYVVHALISLTILS